MIDEELQEFVRQIDSGWRSFPDLSARPMAYQRQAAEQVRAPWTSGGPVMARRSELAIPYAHGAPVRARLLSPAGGSDRQAVLIYLHGGGFTTFSIDTHERIMREYAERAGIAVLGVDYALSPEAKFPAALDQIGAVVDWLGKEAPTLGLDAGRIAIGGDSAGANLALSTCLRLRDRGESGRIAAMLFAYGFFDDDFTTASHREHGADGNVLTTAELGAFLDNYLGETAHRHDPLALPARADLHGLPPSFHIIAGCDPLCDGDRAIAARMAAAGCQVRAEVYAGAVHSFLEAVSISALSERAFRESAAWLKDALAPSDPD